MIVALYSFESGSGKDTVADSIREWCHNLSISFSRAAFADQMKVVCADALGIESPYPSGTIGDVQFKVAAVDKIKLTGSVHYRWQNANKVTQQSPGTSGREFIIGLAESIRRLDPEFWIRHTTTSDADVHVITDMRFAPEAEYVRKQGGLLIEVRRIVGNLGHHNEDLISCDAVINNNGTLDELHELTRSCMYGLGVHQRQLT